MNDFLDQVFTNSVNILTATNSVQTMYFIWIFLVTTFFDSGLCTNFKRFDKTTFMSEDVWNEKKFDFSTKTSLITCVAYCMSWSGTGSEKICNAVSYDKGIEITKVITLSKVR